MSPPRRRGSSCSATRAASRRCAPGWSRRDSAPGRDAATESSPGRGGSAAGRCSATRRTRDSWAVRWARRTPTRSSASCTSREKWGPRWSASSSPAAPGCRRATTRSPATAGSSGRASTLSRLVPQVSIVTGVSAGGGAYSPALTDFVVMTEEARMFLTGPKIVEAALGEQVSMEDLGGPACTHETASASSSHPASARPSRRRASCSGCCRRELGGAAGAARPAAACAETRTRRRRCRRRRDGSTTSAT